MFIYGERPHFDLTSVATGGEPSSLGEIASTSVEAMRLVENANATRIASERAYDDRIDEIFKVTGKRLDNPERVDMRDVTWRGEINKLAHGSSLQKDPHAEFQSQLNQLSTEMPQFRDVIAPDRPIRKDAQHLANRADHRAGATWEKSDGGFLAWSARLAGGLYGAAHDPVNVATLLVGPMKPAQAGIKGLLWMATKQAVANAGTEALIQPFTQRWRAEAGLDHGLGLAVSNIALAATFGFGADTQARGAVRGARRVVGRPWEPSI